MTPAAIADRFLALALKAEAFAPPPRDGELLAMLGSMDALAVRLSRLMVANEPPMTLHGAARALHSMTVRFDEPTPDHHAAESAERLARRALVAAYQLHMASIPPRLRNIEETASE